MKKTHQKSKNTLHKLQVAIAACAALPLALSGCAALSESSASSASVSSISASSTAIFASAGSAFRDDVRIAAAASVESGLRSEELLSSIGQVASTHGISDWEVNTATYFAVGEGLRDGGLDEAALLAMAEKLAGENIEAKESLLAGYRAV